MESGDEAGLSTSATVIPGATAATIALNNPIVAASGSGSTPKPGAGPGDEDGEGEDEWLPAMADDDYSAQLSWQSESKDNLKVLMDNFSPAQYDRFEAYRRHALPKQAVRRVIQQTTGQQVSQPVAQIVAGFAKVFVGEIVEKARAVQARRGDTGPLSPDHLREAYRLYQAETGRVGSARAGRGKRLFVR
ncbi:TAFII28-domain-containing protein [Gyrodon lividus]|nr:TAFII28-domain-containing protein [Gyrodon lividus]